jgi:hypothetical protein
MRLTDIIGLVKTVTDYDPTVTTYDDEVTRLINNALFELFAEKAFTFAQKETVATAYADVTTTGSTTNGSTDVTAFTVGASWMDGQVAEVGGVEYDIAWIDVATNTLYLTKPYEGLTAAGVAVKVKHRFVDLPQDCVSVLQIGTRDRVGNANPADIGNFASLTRFEDEMWALPLDEVGTSTHWVHHDDFTVPSPVGIGSSTLTPGPALSVGTEYSFVRTFVYGNRRSAPSPAITATPTGGTPGITVNMAENGVRSGYYQELWVKFSPYKAYRSVPPGTSYPPGAAVTVVPLAPPGNDWQFMERLSEVDGNYQRIRMYPRQAVDTEITVRYMYRPPMLIEDTDSPQFPAAHHQYLAYRALSDLFVKHNNLPQHKIYQDKAEDEIIKLEQRYMTEIPRRWVKNGGDSSLGGYRDKWGPLSHS